jgi:hypothetical protein
MQGRKGALMEGEKQRAGKVGAHHSPGVDELERQVAALESAVEIMQAERRAKGRPRGGMMNPKNFI